MSDNPFSDILHKLNEMDRRLNNMVRIGRVKEVNHKRAQARFEDGVLGETDFLDWQETGSGGVRTWNPPSVGQEAILISPSGEPGQGILLPGSYNKNHKAPSSDASETVLYAKGGVRIAVKGSTFTVSAGGTTFAFSSAGFVQTGGKQEHDGRNTGKDHTHKNVEPGGGNSGEPN